MAAWGRIVRPELVMTLPRTVAEVLCGHVAFEVECIDRMYPLSELGGESSRFLGAGRCVGRYFRGS